jgi:hypothetical protein
MPEQFPTKLKDMLASDQYAIAADNFARCYANFDPQQQINAIISRAEELISN